jgi:hypothetical protein
MRETIIKEVGVQDKVPLQEDWNKQGLVFHSTNELINAIKNIRSLSVVEMPDKIMMTFHTQKWHDSFFPWAKELIMQNAKNVIKKYFFVK